MKFLKSIFGLPEPDSKEGQTGILWNPLRQVGDLDLLDENRKSRPQLIFKHSTSCGLSGMMLRRFEKQWEFSEDRVDLHFLDLLRYREVSHAIAERYGVMHQSPQVLILNQKGVYKHASHGDIGRLQPDDISENPA